MAMHRYFVSVLILALFSFLVFAADAEPGSVTAELIEVEALMRAVDPSLNSTHHINLNDPDALAELRRDNPAHYFTIRKMISGPDGQPLPRGRGWMEASYRVRIVQGSTLFLTSAPARQRLRITLDDTTYYALVTLASGRPSILVPTKQ